MVNALRIMKKIRILITLILVHTSNLLFAQWHFTYTIVGNDCGIIQDLQTESFSTLEDCKKNAKKTHRSKYSTSCTYIVVSIDDKNCGCSGKNIPIKETTQTNDNNTSSFDGIEKFTDALMNNHTATVERNFEMQDYYNNKKKAIDNEKELLAEQQDKIENTKENLRSSIAQKSRFANLKTNNQEEKNKDIGIDINAKPRIFEKPALENFASNPISEFDAIKKEIKVDLKFRNEVALSIQVFLDNKTGSIPQLMRDLYKERTGYDINELLNKQYLTEDERKIAEDYNHFVKQMVVELDYQANESKKNPSPEKKLIDFSIMARDVYKDSDYSGLKDTDWRPLSSSQGVEDKAIAKTIDAINQFNKQGDDFYAQIYKNDLTGEYTLAFRGSEINGWKNRNDWADNVLQGLSLQGPQYANAAILGELLGSTKQKVNIVGHSLGGGLATVVGLKTGLPTYTYNQAYISQGTIDKYKLDVGKTENITAYYIEGEILTTLQNKTRDYNTLIPLGKRIKIGSVITEENAILTGVSDITQVMSGTGAQIIGTSAVILDKGDNLTAMIDGHRIPHMEQYFRSVYGRSQVKWENYNNTQLVLRNNDTYSKLLIDTK